MAPSRWTVDLAIVAIVKDEAAYLPEWIAYHEIAGVRHFILYDNDSSDSLSDVLRAQINHGLVTVVRWPVRHGQAAAYNHAVRFLGGTARWFAPIDVDEFLVPVGHHDLGAALAEVDADQVVVPWRVFGFGGHERQEAGLVIDRFRLAQDIPSEGLARIAVKSLVRPESVVRMAVHVHRTTSGSAVVADGTPAVLDQVRLGLERPRYEILQLNHYYTKSREEYATKCVRGDVNGAPQPAPEHFEVGYGTPDDAIVRFIEPTRSRLDDHAALPPQPFRYGSLLAVPHFGMHPFAGHARRTIANHLQNEQVVRNSAPALPDLADLPSVVLIDSEAAPSTPTPANAFAAGIHFRDLVHRLGATIVSRLIAGPELGGDRFDACAPVLDATLLRHYAVVATAVTAGPAELRCSLEPAGGEATTVSIPRAGSFIVAAEVNGHLARATHVQLCASGPLERLDLSFLSYG